MTVRCAALKHAALKHVALKHVTLKHVALKHVTLKHVTLHNDIHCNITVIITYHVVSNNFDIYVCSSPLQHII